MICAQAQPFQDLLLPQAQHIVGVVVDAEGKPVAKARIDHTGDYLHSYETDSHGRFELVTRAPVLVIRKQGFRSELLQTGEADVHVVLRKLGETRTFPSCSSAVKYVGIGGWAASFQFPVVSGVKVSKQGRDIDYGVRSYYIKTARGPKGIMHGSGPMWSFGTPSDDDVWRSVQYEEVSYDVGGITIIDARGQLKNGNQWRYVGMFGESASYSDVDEATTKILDRVLDGACLKPPSRP